MDYEEKKMGGRKEEKEGKHRRSINSVRAIVSHATVRQI